MAKQAYPTFRHVYFFLKNQSSSLVKYTRKFITNKDIEHPKKLRIFTIYHCKKQSIIKTNLTH